MFYISEDLTIHITRGDTATFSVSANAGEAGYEFIYEDILRFKVFAKKNCEEVVLQKDIVIPEDTEKVRISLTKEDTKIGDVISKPTDYWYEVELNPDTNPQTIIGYDEDGAKVFKLYPEGGVANE